MVVSCQFLIISLLSPAATYEPGTTLALLTDRQQQTNGIKINILCFLFLQKSNLGRAGAEIFCFLSFICLVLTFHFLCSLCEIWVRMANY